MEKSWLFRGILKGRLPAVAILKAKLTGLEAVLSASWNRLSPYPLSFAAMEISSLS